MTGWNYANLWESVAMRFGESPALIHGDVVRTWREFDQRSNGLGSYLKESGLQHQSKVAMYLYNGPEYMETVYACFKASLVPINTNYRYVEDELAYLWDNADAEAVVFHGSFSATIEGILDRVPRVTTWCWVDDGVGECPDWATPYEQAAVPQEIPPIPATERSGDDILMIYTGGTTGMPKGVMWRQDDLIHATCEITVPVLAADAESSSDEEYINSLGAPGLIGLPACPLMHGTGWFTAMIYLTSGGCVVTLTERHFDVAEMLDTIQARKVAALTIVGDAFCKPMVNTLDAEPDRWDISSLFLVTSSGVMWSEPVKQALLAHHGTMILMDAFSSSEAIGLGQSTSTSGAGVATAAFQLGANAAVIADDGSLVSPGSGIRGRVAVRGHTPLGYYKDPEKTAATFIEIDGVRYSMPGDYAEVADDGSIILLGRGSVCINTGGEKVFPEEVEEILKLHDSVHDAVVVGVADDRFGQAIVGVVELAPSANVDPDALIQHVRNHLAAYKAPKSVLFVDSIGRAPNGKVDYKRHTQYAESHRT